MTLATIDTLALLQQSTNKELETLVNFILNAELTEGLSINDVYKKYAPNHSMYVEEILNEICAFGGNTFANMFRGKGVDYKEVVQDAAQKIGVKEIENKSLLEIEEKIIEHFWEKIRADQDSNESKEIKRAMLDAGLSEKNYKVLLAGAPLAAVLTPHLLRIFMQTVSAQIFISLAGVMLKLGLTTAAATATIVGARSLILGPIGLALTGIWAVGNVAGPAYRVTLPCALYIAWLRQEWLCKKETDSLNGAFDD